MYGTLNEVSGFTQLKLKGSMTHLQVLQISVKFLLQMASDIIRRIKSFTTQYTFQLGNKKTKTF